MTQIIQDYKDLKDAKKNVVAIKTALHSVSDIVPGVCKVYPCFDTDNTEEYIKDIIFYETFCKDCRKFKILLQLNKALQKHTMCATKII